MKIKSTFDYISWAQLAKWMVDLGIDNYLMDWSQSFLSNRLIKLVIDGFTNPRPKVEIKIS